MSSNITGFTEGYDPNRDRVRNELYKGYRAGQGDESIYYPQLNKMDDDELLYRFNNFGRSREEQKELEELYEMQKEFLNLTPSDPEAGFPLPSLGPMDLDIPYVFPDKTPLYKTSELFDTQPKLGSSPAQRYQQLSPEMPWWLRSHGVTSETIVSQQRAAEAEYEAETEAELIKERHNKIKGWTAKALATKSRSDLGYLDPEQSKAVADMMDQDYRLIMADMVASSQTGITDLDEEFILEEISSHPEEYSSMNMEVNRLIRENPDVAPITIVGSVIKSFADAERDSSTPGTFDGGVFAGFDGWVNMGEGEFLRRSIEDFRKTFAGSQSAEEFPYDVEVERTFAECIEGIEGHCIALEGTDYDVLEVLYDTGAFSDKEMIAIAQKRVNDRKIKEGIETEELLSKEQTAQILKTAKVDSQITDKDNLPKIRNKLMNLTNVLMDLIGFESRGVDVTTQHKEALDILREARVVLPQLEGESFGETLQRSLKAFNDNVLIKFNRRSQMLTTDRGKYELATINSFKKYVSSDINSYQDVQQAVYSAIYDTDPDMTINRKLAIIELYNNGRAAFKRMQSGRNSTNGTVNEIELMIRNSDGSTATTKKEQTDLGLFEPPKSGRDTNTWNQYVLERHKHHSDQMVQMMFPPDPAEEVTPEEQAQRKRMVDEVFRIKQTGSGQIGLEIDWNTANPMVIPGILGYWLDYAEKTNVTDLGPMLKGFGQQVKEGLDILGTEELDASTEQGRATIRKAFKAVSTLGFFYSSGNTGDKKAKQIKDFMGWQDGDYAAYRTVLLALKASGNEQLRNMANFYSLDTRTREQIANNEQVQTTTITAWQRDSNQMARAMFSSLANRAGGAQTTLTPARRNSIDSLYIDRFLDSFILPNPFDDETVGSQFFGIFGGGVPGEVRDVTDAPGFNTSIKSPLTGLDVDGLDKARHVLQAAFPATRFTEFKAEDWTKLNNTMAATLGMSSKTLEKMKERFVDSLFRVDSVGGEMWTMGEDPQAEMLSYMLIREFLQNNTVRDNLRQYTNNRAAYTSQIPLSIEEVLSVGAYMYKGLEGISPAASISIAKDGGGVFSYASPTADTGFMEKLQLVDVPESLLDNTHDTAMNETFARMPFNPSGTMQSSLESQYLIAENNPSVDLMRAQAVQMGLDENTYNKIAKKAIEAAMNAPDSTPLHVVHLGIMGAILEETEKLRVAQGDNTVASFFGLTKDVLSTQYVEELDRAPMIHNITEMSNPKWWANYAMQIPTMFMFEMIGYFTDTDPVSRLLDDRTIRQSIPSVKVEFYSPTPGSLNTNTGTGDEHIFRVRYTPEGVDSKGKSIKERVASFPFIKFKGEDHK